MIDKSASQAFLSGHLIWIKNDENAAGVLGIVLRSESGTRRPMSPARREPAATALQGADDIWLTELHDSGSQVRRVAVHAGTHRQPAFVNRLVDVQSRQDTRHVENPRDLKPVWGPGQCAKPSGALR